MQPHRKKELTKSVVQSVASTVLVLFWTAVVIGVGVLSIAVTMVAIKGLYKFVDGFGKPFNDPVAKSGDGHSSDSKPVARLEPAHDWPTDAQPDMVFILSGEMLGYLTPCGCSEDQEGGLFRRAGVLKYLKAKRNFDPVLLDMGDIVKSSGKLETLRYYFGLEMLDKMGYDAIAVGGNDLAIGMQEVIGAGINLSKAKLSQMGFKNELFESVFEPKCVVINKNNKKIAVATMIGKDHATSLKDASVKARDEQETLGLIKASLEKEKPDYRVLLTHMYPAAAREFAKANQDFDVILCVSDERFQNSTDQEGYAVGKSFVTWVGTKGLTVGLLGIYANRDRRFMYDLVELDGRFEEDSLMRDTYGRFVARVKSDKIIESTPKLPPPVNATYVGAAKCGECHKSAFATWSASKHSHALETLATKAKVPHQEYNPECVKCHTTGFEFRTGFVTLPQSAPLAGNGCENCHGPGSKHAEEPTNPEFLTMVRRSQKTIESTCVKCHDSENSLHFKFETYWPKVVHGGLQADRDAYRQLQERKKSK